MKGDKKMKTKFEELIIKYNEQAEDNFNGSDIVSETDSGSYADLYLVRYGDKYDLHYLEMAISN